MLHKFRKKRCTWCTLTISSISEINDQKVQSEGKDGNRLFVSLLFISIVEPFLDRFSQKIPRSDDQNTRKFLSLLLSSSINGLNFLRLPGQIA
jgi:hypothetical protein